VGILAAQIVNWLIAQKTSEGATEEAIRQSWNGQYGWRWMFTAVAVPSVIFFSLRLVRPGKSTMAGRSKKVRLGTSRSRAHRWTGLCDADVGRHQQYSLHYPRTLVPPAGAASPSPRAAVRNRDISSGSSAMERYQRHLNYAEEIYKSAGYNISDILFNIIITGAINLILPC
jgi:MFS transporter, SP family, xylose:H+ symportor